MSYSITRLDLYPSSGSLANIVEDYTYKCLTPDNLPHEISNNGLCKKFNSVILAASGSSSGICYAVVGIRPDKNNTVIDEHPFLYYYDHQDTSKNFAIIVHHGNWDKRTFDLTSEQTDLLNKCGLTADITFKNIPQQNSGSLFSLYQSGSLVGMSSIFEILIEEKEKKQ